MASASSDNVLTTSPFHVTLPVFGRSSPASKPSNVVLPEPDAPTMASVSPAVTVSDTSSKMVSLRSPSGTTRDKRSAAMAGGALLEGVVCEAEGWVMRLEELFGGQSAQLLSYPRSKRR